MKKANYLNSVQSDRITSENSSSILMFQPVSRGKYRWWPKALAFAVFLLFMIGSFTQLFGQKTWDGGGDGTTWGSANNWNPNGLPASTDDVTLTQNQTVTVNITTAVCKNLNLSPTGNGIATLQFNNSSILTSSGIVTLGQASNTNRRGTLIMTSGGTLICQGFVLANAGANTFTPGTGTVQLTATNTLPATIFTSFNNLTINGGTTTLGVALSVSGTLNVTSPGTLNVAAIATLAADEMTGNGTITKGSAGAHTFTVGAGNTNSEFSGIIQNPSGTIALTKTGTGTLTLSGANSYTGATTIGAGTIKLGTAGSGANSPLGVISGITSVTGGAALDLNGFTLATAEPLTLNGTGISSGGALMNSGTSATYSGLITLGSASSIDGGTGTIAISNTGTITGATFGLTLGGIQGGTLTSILGTTTGTLTKEDAGTWTLTGVNTYTGPTRINAGVLSVATIGIGGVAGNLGQASNLAANIVLGGGTLAYTGVTASTDRNFTLTAATTSSIDITNVLTMPGATGTATTGALTKIGTGTLILSGSNTYTGLTTVSAGTLKLGAADRIANTSDLTVNGTFDLNGFNETVAGLSGTGTITSSAAGTISFTGGNGTNTTFSGVIQNGSATSVSFTKAGAGSLTLTGNNTYTGTTTITAGTLITGAANVIPTNSLTLNGGTLSTGSGAGFTETIGTLNLNATSIISLGTGLHTLTFANSSGVTWAGTTLTINGWTGGYDGTASATAGRIFVGTSSGGVTGGQLAKIQFFDATNSVYEPAVILSSGEVVPIRNAPASLSYPSPNVFANGVAITPLNPTVTGVVTSYSVSPSLPAGLSLNTSTGVISGTPTAVTAAATYTVTATNFAGNTTFGVVISVENVRYAVASGDWNVTSTWSATSGGAGGAGVPVAGDVVYIEGGHNVTVTAAAACTSITFTTTATSLTINSGITLNVSGAITIPRSGTTGVNLIAVGSGILNAASIAFTNGGGGVRHQITISTGTVSVTGDITTDNTGVSASITFTGTGLLQVGGQLMSSGTVGGTLTTVAGCTVDYDGTAQTVKPVTYAGNLTLSGSGAKTTTGATVNGTLSIQGIATATGTSPAYGASAILEYKGSSAQTTSNVEFPASTAVDVTINNALGVTLNAAKTTTGMLTMTSGTLNMANTNLAIGSLTGSGNLTHSSGTAGARTLTIGSDGTSPAAYSGVISNGTATSVAVTKSGTGTLTLSGDNTYTGATTINAGTLKLGSSTALGAVAGNTVIASGAVLDMNGQSVGNEELEIQGTGISSAGALINSSGTAASLSGDINNTLSDAGVYSVGGSSDITLTGNVQGRITKVSTNILTLSGTVDNVGLGITVNAGSVVLAKASNGGVHSLGGAGFTVSGGTLKLGGSGGDQIYDFTGNTIINSGTFDLNGQNETISAFIGSGGTILNNGGSASTLTAGIDNSSKTYSGIIANGSSGAGGMSLVKVGTGIQTLSGINTYSGTTTVNGGTLKAGVVTQAFGVGSAVTLANTAGVVLDITGYSNTIGSLTGGGGTGGNVTLGTTATLTVGSDNTSPAAFAGVISGTGGALTKTGNGTLTLSGANTFTGLTTVNGGILEYGVNNALSNGAVTISGGSLDILTFSDAVGAVTLTSGSIDGTSGVLTGTSYTMQSGSVSAILAGAIGLSKTTTGTVILSGANTYTGLTTISAGTLKLGADGGTINTPLGTTGAGTTVTSGAALDLNGFTLGTNEALTLNGTGISNGGALMNSGTAATYSGLITLGSASSIVGGTGTISISNAGTITGATFGLTLGGAQGGTLSSILGTTSGTLTKADAGTWTLSGASTYTGITTISAGTIKLGAAGSGANSPLGVIGGLTSVTSGAALDLNGITLVTAEPLTLNGTGISGSGALTNNSATAASYSGLITLGSTGVSIEANAGNINITNASTITGATFGLTLGGAQGGTLTSILGTTSGTLTKADAGTWTLSGANTYTGATTISAGTLKLGAAERIANTSTLTVTGTFDLAGFSETVAALSGAGIVTSTAAGTLTLTVGDASNTSFSGVIQNGSATSVSFSKAGAGILTLSGNNAYTGTTTINAGAIQLGAADVLPNYAITLNGGTLSTGSGAGFSETIGAITLSATSTIALGTGVHTLTIANSSTATWGAFTLNINGWTGLGGAGGTATAGKIMVGAGGISAGQLAKVTFSGGYPVGAVITASGELVPNTPTIYYSQGSVTPNTFGNWNTIRTGGGSSPGNFTAGNVFVVQNTHTMTTNAAWSVSGTNSRVLIENGGTLVASNAITLATATYFQIENGGTYKHNNTGAWATTIFQGTEVFGNSSTVEINQTNATLPTNSTYGNLTFNLTADPGAALSFGGNLTTINGNFTIQNTQSREVRISANTSPTVTIAGNLAISGSTSSFTLTSGTGNPIVSVAGNVTLSGGTFSLSGAAGISTLNVAGNFSHTGGTITETSTGSGSIVFNGSSTQNYIFSGGTVSNAINFTVSGGSTLYMGTSLLGNGSAGTFSLLSGGTLGIGNAGGIAISGQTGNIRVSGTRTYNAGANYIYNGTADQVTGDGLTQNTPADLTIFNTGTTNKTVSLSAATILTGNLLISQGILSSSAGNYNMTVGGNWTNNGTFTANSNTVTFNGTTQTIGGTTPLEKFNSLTISSSTSTTANVNEDLTANLNISSGSLIISAGHYLNVGGSTTLGSAECLILKSDATGTASFIDNGTISGTGTAKVERYLTKYNYAGLPPDYKFHFLSSPVVGQAIMPEFQTMSNRTDDFYMWDEQAPIDQWINTKSGDGITLPFTWNPDFEAANGSSFVSGRGYLVAYPTDVTKYFIGKPYTNAAGLTVTCTHTTAPGTDPIRGWNLIGNPFPSAVDWDYMISNSLLSTNVDHALYYYDNSVPRYRYYIPLTGGIGNSLSGADGYIPAMQGVMVHVNLPGTSESVTFRNDARDHRNLTTYYKDAPLTDNVLNIKVEGDNSRDDARICFYDLATENFDGSYDAYKLFSYNTTIPELYSVTTDSSQLAINTLPLSQMYVTVPLGFLPGTTGIFTFSAEGVNRFPSTTYIFLEDLKTKTLQKLNDNQAYNFTSTPSDDANRFLLHFQDATSISNPEIGKNITIHAENGVITVLQTGNQNGNIKVTDLAGRTVSTTNLIAGSPAIINMHGNPGVYIVSIITNNGVSNAKIIVK